MSRPRSPWDADAAAADDDNDDGDDIFSSRRRRVSTITANVSCAWQRRSTADRAAGHQPME